MHPRFFMFKSFFEKLHDKKVKKLKSPINFNQHRKFNHNEEF